MSPTVVYIYVPLERLFSYFRVRKMIAINDVTSLEEVRTFQNWLAHLNQIVTLLDSSICY